MRFVIVTGMSGAGKSTAMKMMEDIGFFCIDNLPIPLVEKLVEFYEKFESNIDKVALGVDIRDKEGLNHMDKTLSNLDDKKVRYDILFLDAENEVLIKRYKETRRNHPLAGRERIEKEMISCEEYQKRRNNPKDKEQLERMIKEVGRERIQCLRISDYNTTGLLGVASREETSSHSIFSNLFKTA